MKTIAFLLFLSFVSCSPLDRKEKDDSSAEQALKEGFVFVDGSQRVIHWDKSCKRAVQKVMLLKGVDDLRRDIEFCSCVPVSKMREINKIR